MSPRIALLTATWLIGAGTAPANEEMVEAAAGKLSPPISAPDLQTDVHFIASDECAGRLTGSPGAQRAAEYIVAVFKQAHLKAAGVDGSYYQPFEFNAGVDIVPTRNLLEAHESDPDVEVTDCKINADFVPLTFSANGSVEGQVVFAGYGLVEPEGEGNNYDSYAQVDLTDKIVLILRDVPENIPPQRRQQLSLYAGDRYKAKLAADRGAKGVLLVTGPNSPHSKDLVRFKTSDRISRIPIPAASVTAELADRLLNGSGTNLLQKLQTTLDAGDVPPHGQVIGKNVRLSVELNRLRKTCRNVIGLLPPVGASDEYVMVGAHYDHIGTGEGLGSLAREGERGQIHNGADDNASGTATVLELAAALAERRRQTNSHSPQRGVIFACWSGEELGLVGSSHYAHNPLIPLEKTIAYVNFDMVGRLRDNHLVVQAVGSSPVWRRMIERRNVPAGFNLTLQNDPYLPTDATAFYTKGLPILAFFTAVHEDYNRPTDDPQTLNYEGMERIAQFARMLVEDIAEPKTEIPYARVERSTPMRSRTGRRAYTGLVPDFTDVDIQGLRLSDVRSGGPAAQAGLKGGDVIVEFAGKKINGLQDYSDALTGAKVGQPVDVIIVRDGKRLTLTITPGVRE